MCFSRNFKERASALKLIEHPWIQCELKQGARTSVESIYTGEQSPLNRLGMFAEEEGGCNDYSNIFDTQEVYLSLKIPENNSLVLTSEELLVDGGLELDLPWRLVKGIHNHCGPHFELLERLKEVSRLIDDSDALNCLKIPLSVDMAVTLCSNLSIKDHTEDLLMEKLLLVLLSRMPESGVLLAQNSILWHLQNGSPEFHKAVLICIQNNLSKLVNL